MELAVTIANSITMSNQFGTNFDNGTDKISIGFGINAKYARPLGVTITSITVNNPDLFLDFHVFASSIEYVDLERMQKLSMDFPKIAIHVYQVNDAFISHLPVLKHIPLPMYFRLFMPFILKDRNKVLYLDSDVICLNNISELIHLDMNHYPAAVIPDIPRTAIKQSKRLNLESESYFNSGVILINVEEWLKQTITEQVLSTLSESSTHFFFPDQDALNLVLEGKKITLDRKWNCILENESGEDIPDDTIFLHCTARPKPWEVACDKKSQAYRLYSQYESLSPWRGLPLLQPSIPSDARIYARKLFAEGHIIAGTAWFYRYLTMKYGSKN